MKKDDLLKTIAETGYNVGFGAKKHFATYDILDKAPGFISLASSSFGIYALASDGLKNKFISASFIVLGIVGLYINFYAIKKSDYEKSGVTQTKLYNQLGDLYREVKGLDENDYLQRSDEFSGILNTIRDEYYDCCQSKQIFLSDWYAHYKFFWQHQIDWVKEGRKFNFFRDMIPLSFWLSLIALIIILVVWKSSILSFLCQYV